MFQINEKVVCVIDLFDSGSKRRHSKLPIKGQYYVVRETFSNPYGENICLVGIEGEWDQFGEWGFRAERFRRLVEVQAENRLVRELELKLCCEHRNDA